MKNKKMEAYILNDLIDFNINELVTYIEDNFTSVDIFNIKKNYVYLQPNGQNLNNILTSFIIEKISEIEDEIDDLEITVADNMDRFFDITEKSEDTVIVERVQND